MFALTLLRSGLACCCQIVLVKRLSNQSLDYCLAADVQLFCCVVQFVQHRRREIYIDMLDRTHHVARVREKTRDIFSVVGETRNSFCRHGLLPFTSALHKAVAPVSLLSTESRRW